MMNPAAESCARSGADGKKEGAHSTQGEGYKWRPFVESCPDLKGGHRI